MRPMQSTSFGSLRVGTRSAAFLGGVLVIFAFVPCIGARAAYPSGPDIRDPAARGLPIVATPGGREGDSVAVPPRADSAGFVPFALFTYGGAPRATLYGALPLARTNIDPLRAGIVGGALTGLLIGLHLNMTDAWWREGAAFHWKNDWDDVLQMDKAGHATAGYMMSYGLGEALMATGVSYDVATVAGGLLGFAYQTYVELEDGYAENWGFSPSDMGANAFGAGLYLAQGWVPALQNFTPKYLYVPPSWIDAPRLSTTWIDNYNSSTFWLSANVHNLLPASLRDGWPVWLDLAVGYGVTIDDRERTRHLLLALDYDLVRILPSGGHVWNWLRQSLNFVKLPAPALELTPRPRFHLLFPFTFTIH